MLAEILFPAGWQHYLLGGLWIGLAMATLFVLTGRVGGMDTVYTAAWSYVSRAPYFRQPRFAAGRRWRLAFAAGVLIGAALWWWLAAPRASIATGLPWWQLLAGGFIAGFGAAKSNGCTSGHGLCGLASLQLPSALAVLTFLVTAVGVAQLTWWLWGR
jgi:hypothetical protein